MTAGLRVSTYQTFNIRVQNSAGSDLILRIYQRRITTLPWNYIMITCRALSNTRFQTNPTNLAGFQISTGVFDFVSSRGMNLSISFDIQKQREHALFFLLNRIFRIEIFLPHTSKLTCTYVYIRVSIHRWKGCRVTPDIVHLILRLSKGYVIDNY